MLKKDLILSLVAHLLLMAAIAIVNPISAMLRPKPEIIIVRTYEEMGGGAKRADPEPANIAPPKSGKTPEEVDDTPKIKEPEKKAAPVEKPKEKPKKKEPEKKKKEVVEKRTEEEDSQSKTESNDNTPRVKSDGGIEVNEKVGGTGAGAGVGSGSGNLPYNIGKVIERNWRNVVTDVNPITCTVYFQIDRYGYVVGEPIIEKSSGMTAFDQGCVLAIKRAGQFPAFPASFDYQYIGLHLDFEYVPGM